MTTKVGELVRIAKGEDRSIREYARQAGVDPAIISKIINGEYTPKKHDIYEKLSSADAAPRGGVTFKQLIEAVDETISYKAGIAAGAATLTTILGRLGGIPVAGLAMSAIDKEKKYNDENYKKTQTRINQFVAFSNGILFTEMAKNGVKFQIIPQQHKDILQNDFDTWLAVEDISISEVLLRYIYLSEEESEVDLLVENTARRIVESLMFLEKSKKRYTCILTNSKQLFDYLVAYKDKISFYGYLSTILVDETNVCISDESVVSVPVDCDAIAILTSKGQLIDPRTNRIIGLASLENAQEKDENTDGQSERMGAEP